MVIKARGELIGRIGDLDGKRISGKTCDHHFVFILVYRSVRILCKDERGIKKFLGVSTRIHKTLGRENILLFIIWIILLILR